MKNLKFWRTALVATLVLTVMLSVTGGTIAWFTDSVASNGNKIQAGTLDIKLHQLTVTGWTDISDSTAALFNSELWEPGRVEYKVLKVENAGTLALKWKTQITADAELSALADVIDVYTMVGVETLPGSREEVATWTKEATLAEFINNAEGKTIGSLEAKKAATLGIALKMREEAGNEYQGLSLGNLDIKILATQDTVEFDSFDDQYDAEAQYPKANAENGVSTKEEFVAAFASIQNGDTVKLLNDIELGDIDIELKNYAVTGTETLEGTTVNAVEYTDAVYNIDLNGHKLSATDHAIDLHGGTLNIMNGTISVDSADQSGTFISVGGHSPVYDVHKAMKCGQDEYNPASVLNLENVVFEGTMLTNTTGTTSGHIIYVNCHAQVHVKNCSFKTMMDNGVYANHIDVNMNAAAMIEKATAVYVYEGTKFYGDPTFQAFKNVDNTDWEVKAGHLIYIADGYKLEAAPIADGDTYAWYTVVAE